jgi:ABC-type lipoprotein export system ATPase subunit
MKLSGIKIEKLFGQFDYDIKLNQEEGITILTGPNGYGKTTILNIIWSLFNQDFEYIHSVPFKKIFLNLDNDQKIRVTPMAETGTRATQNGSMRVTHGGAKRGVYITKLCFELVFKDTVLETFKFSGEKSGEDQTSILNILENIKVYFIKDQRLAQEIVPKYDGTFKHDGTTKANGAAVLVKTISLYSTKLIDSILEKKTKEQQLADKLASSQHNRIKALHSPLAESEFRERFNALRERYRQLQNIGIYTVDLEDTDYKDNKGYLSIFLEDWEKRMAVYDDLLLKINLFLSILKRKQLVNKTVSIQFDKGFCFTDSEGKPLPLTALSSGEQNETVLLYELLFNAPPNSLVLIDEPETSMHVAWQIEFIRDLKKITGMNLLSFIIATHSPDIINDNSSIDLYELIHGDVEGDNE